MSRNPGSSRHAPGALDPARHGSKPEHGSNVLQVQHSGEAAGSGKGKSRERRQETERGAGQGGPDVPSAHPAVAQPGPSTTQSASQRSAAHGGTDAESISSAPPASTTSSYEPLFRMRLNNIDHVLSTPLASFDRITSPFSASRQPLKHVPVLRLFGATLAGQRVCAHVHGIFPYLYVGYTGSLDPEAVLTYIDKLGRQLNSALAASQKLSPDEARKYCGIVAINLVKGTPFYGYHAGWSYFLKISFVNPRHSSRIIAMLESERIMGTSFTIFEGHIRYQLQFMLDYNLLGCGFVDFEDVLFRLPVPSAEDHVDLMSAPSTQPHLWNDKTIPEHCLPAPDSYSLPAIRSEHPVRASYCTLELDASSQSILNRRLIKPRPIHRSFGEAAHTHAHSQGLMEKLVPSLNGLWEEEAQRRRAAGLPATIPTPQTLGDDRVDPNNEQRGKWRDEARLYALMDARIRQDANELERRNARPDGFLQRHDMDRFILTTFESVEAFQLDNVHGARKKKKWRASPVTMTALARTAANRDSKELETIAVDISNIIDSDSASSFEAEAQPRLSQERFQASKLYDLRHQSQEATTGTNGNDHTHNHLQKHSPERSSGDADDKDRHVADNEEDVDIAFFASQHFVEAVAAQDRDNEENLHFPSLEGEEEDAAPPNDVAADEWEQRNGTPRSTPGSRTGTPSRRGRGGRSLGEGAMWGSPPVEVPTSGQSTSRQTRAGEASLKRKARGPSDDSAEFSKSVRRRTVTFDATPVKAAGPSISPVDEDEMFPQTPTKSLGRTTDLIMEPHFEPSPPRKVLEEPWQPSSAIKTPRTSSSSAFTGSSPIKEGNEELPDDDVEAVPKPHTTTNTYTFSIPPPTRFEVINSFGFFGLPSVDYRDPFYSDPKDLPAVPGKYGGKLFRFQSVTISYLREFRHDEAAELDDEVIRRLTSAAQTTGRGAKESRTDHSGPGSSPLAAHARNGTMLTANTSSRSLTPSNAWQFGLPPPTRRSTEEWSVREDVSRKDERKRKQKLFQSQIAKPTPSSFGFKISQNPGAKFANRDKQHMTVLVLDVHVCTRDNFLPDPEHDEIKAILFNFNSEGDSSDLMPASRSGAIMLRPDNFHPHRLALPCDDVFVFDTELEVIMVLIDVVRELDPEILAGYEIHNSSWGYVIERAAKHFEYNIVPDLGRIREETIGGELNSTGWDFAMSSALRVTGRHILNIWRLMRGEMNLNLYSFENVVYHLLHKRVPKFSHATLTEFYASPHAEVFCRPLRYWLDRIQLIQAMIESSDLVFRTAEFARVYGIDFFSVINRGSQFKVESVMLRIAKPESFVLLSPNIKQRESQNTIGCFPLVMEPQSAFYKGPLLVLDFVSLYPSLMIAYNICYSTCLGRVESYKGTSKFGCTEYDPPLGALTLAKDRLHVSPNGMIYVKSDVRKSLLAKMLTEILDTRVMVKGTMKFQRDDKAFQRQQNARQLSLKLLANVTYGYTSATWSGRMPCVEIADSIVQYGRETLERSIKEIHSTEEWNAEVVYGDTDSLFVYLPGRSKTEAFRIGQEIADKITTLHPRPVKLKFEKVYLPCVLLAKKRYVGFKYESLGDKEAVFDAKGIETVRRDGHAALQRMLETCIRTLFTSQDLSLVKEYCQQQWRKILENRISIQDFIFAKEVRLGGYSEKGVPPPGAVVATRKMLADKRAEPQHAERVPYIISQGAPGAKLNDQAVPPEVMLQNPALRINSMYYITRTIIPPIARIFNLLGADVASWFRDMPHALKRSEMPSIFAAAAGAAGGQQGQPKSAVSDHFRQEVCLVCGFQSDTDLCIDCRSDPNRTHHTLGARLHLIEARQAAATQLCATCSNLPGAAEWSPCVNVDCALLYSRSTISGEMERTRALVVELEAEGVGVGRGRLVAQAWDW